VVVVLDGFLFSIKIILFGRGKQEMASDTSALNVLKDFREEFCFIIISNHDEM